MSVRLLTGDAIAMLATLPDQSAHCCVTSPPYFGLRSYLPAGHPDKALEIGGEDTPDAYVARLVDVFREVRRVLRDDATLWLNIADSYAGSSKAAQGASGLVAGRKARGAKESYWEAGGADGVAHHKTWPGIPAKNLLMIPARLALAFQADGWILRSEIVWAKKAPMPESVTDRPTSAHEKIFLLAKRPIYYYNADAVKQPVKHPAAVVSSGFGGNKRNGGPTYSGIAYDAAKLDGANLRNVWHLGPSPLAEAHYASFVPEIPRRAILAGCPEGGTVLDPFSGAGTTCLVADRLGRDAIGIDLSAEYVTLARRRIEGDAPMFVEFSA